MKTRRTVTAEQMRMIDRKAIEEYHLPGILLMENAGRAVADAAEDLLLKRGGEGTVAVFCGHGNNGGDGLVAARYLADRGYDVDIILLRPEECFQQDALAHYEIVKALQLPVRMFAPNLSLDEAKVVIDAILGTGTKGEVTGDYRAAIERINISGLPVVAVDIPSGLHADTGKALGPCVAADVTVTMGLAKTGLLAPEAKDFVGRLVVADIGLPRSLIV